jgi:hypothetical protein
LIFQGADFSRLIIVFVSQGILIVLFSILAIRVIRRNRTRAHLALVMFYGIISVGFVLNIAYVLLGPTNNAFLLRTLYVLSSFFIAFSFVFNLIFIIILVRLEVSTRSLAILVVVYGAICLSLYLIPDGISFSPITWVPTYSFTLFIVLCVYFTVFMTLPTLYFSFRLYRTFEAQNLKKRLRLYLIGFIIIMGAIYGAIYFITTDNQLYKTIYGVFALVFEVSAALLIYYGLGRKL